MRLNWWNASDAIEAGTRLADHLRRPDGWGTSAEAQSVAPGKPGRDVARLLQRALREVPPLRLNFYKRARLLNSFKWRLRERGYDRGAADELTQMLLFQLYGARTRFTVSEQALAENPPRGGARRIPSLLAEADTQFAAGRPEQTVARLRRVLRIEPDHAIAHAKLGAALCHGGQYQEAERVLRRAVELDRNSAEAHLNLGALLYRKGEFASAETVLRRAIKLDPRNSEVLVSLGLALGARSRLDHAADCFSKALAIKPRDASALCGLGWLAGIEGRFGDSEKLYRDALVADPRKPYAWASLAEIRRMTTDDGEWLENVNRLITTGITPLDEATLRFAMGKYFDDLGNFAEAFRHYKRANELHKLIVKPYDRKARSSFVDDTIRMYSAERAQQPVEGASRSAKPVFVVGMMRSGTSLVEQIIASHPRAAGAGELDFWSEAARKHKDVLERGTPDKSLATKLAESYLAMLARQPRDAMRVVDKSTFNSDHLGLIHSVFPNARIIYVRRDPVDTCLSCYFQHFANAASFTADLADLAHYYREHHRLMRHWRAVLPAGAMLEVPYAELVVDQECLSRRMIEFVGLEWDPRCLEYYATQRPVLTASNWQVRQRIYSSSVGRWQKYQKFIRPLLELRELEAA